MSVEIITSLMPTLSMDELILVMKTGAELMGKAAKGGKTAPKTARATGIVPPQFAKNNEWVEIVLANAQTNGWEAFEVKDGAEVVEMEASVETEEGPRFEDGSEITMKQAKSLAKHLKDSGSELWMAFSADYDETHPKEEKSASAAASPVRRTRAEISAAAEERKARLEEEKAAKAAVRAAEKEEREAKKVAEAEAKAIAKAEKEAAAAAAKAEKESAKSAKLPAVSSATAARLTAIIAKVKPTAPVAAVAAAPAAAAVSEPAKKSLSQSWKAPAEGAFKAFPFKGKIYMANNKYHVYTKGAAQGELGDWVGQYLVDENRIDDSVQEPEEMEIE